MSRYESGRPLICPHCQHQSVFEEMPEGYASNRWSEAVAQGARKEEPYVRCPICTATFPLWGIVQFIEGTE